MAESGNFSEARLGAENIVDDKHMVYTWPSRKNTTHDQQGIQVVLKSKTKKNKATCR